MDVQNNFIKGRMNKSLDERLIPNGEYVDALNVEVSSVEGTNVGSVKNVKGNTQLTTLEYNGSPLSASAVCIGAVENGATETIYWFVHSVVDGVDMIVSYNESIDALTYHVVSTTVLNFNPEYLITGVNIIDDLLLWTDNYNQPRKINVNRHYPPPVLGVDQIFESDITLIVAPPTEAPGVQLAMDSGFEDYMSDKFICFAYRYKYTDGEYSALSQFTDAAFLPQEFSFNPLSTFANSGMTNLFNKANVSINTGGPNVIGIDLCFKLNDSNIINVVEKFSKAAMGWSDFSTEIIPFGSGQIYTTLPESELLRVYDNVPLKAKAQTIMGNRIIFGNYIDGYNITSPNGAPIDIDYTVSVQNQPVVFPGTVQNFGSTDNTSYTAAPVQPSGAIFNELNLDLSSVTLQVGDVLGIQLQMIAAQAYTGAGVSIPRNPSPFVISTAITLQNSYATAADFAASSEFLSAIGTPLNIQPIDSVCQGATLSDRFACAATIVPNQTTTKTGYGFAATTPNEPIIVTSPVLGNPDIIRMTFPVMQFGPAGPSSVWQYYQFLNDFTLPVGLSTSITYIKSQTNKSLHSSRSYEVAMVYMDSFGRNTTALVCETNSTYVNPSASTTKNSLITTINHLPPAWATRYKFVIKQSSDAYNIIYTDEWYGNATSGYWFRLEGQNQLLPRVGDYLIPKLDGGGALTTYNKVEILDVQSQPEDFFTGAPAGLYMKLPIGNFDPGSGTELLVFETESSEVNDSIYYEGSQSFAISGGYHQGNILNQSAVNPAIVRLTFFNCYAFGNGVEGYKYLDGLVSRSIVLGNRFNAVAEEDYMEAHRFASLTYSGVYNEETNINKLNEFNTALVNYKDLEKSFASIQKLYGRQTDVLVLQEDKISYVLAGKNLLSDAAAGGAITSVPEVLGTQIARLEDYGISQNPESFAAFGTDKFFTDTTRGAVLKLTGSNYGNETLEAVSEYGMGSWFRDEFLNSLKSQKIGGYDPYLDEYVLSIKPESAVESSPIIVPCNTFINTSIGSNEITEFTLALGEVTGSFDLVWNIGLIAGDLEFKVIFNGVTTTSGPVSTPGSMAVNKPTAFPTEATVQIISIGGGGQYELEITCP